MGETDGEIERLSERGVRGNGKRRVIGRFRALCRSPRLRGCVCATLFAQQLEAGISSPRKSPPHAAQVRKGENYATAAAAAAFLPVVVGRGTQGAAARWLAGTPPPPSPPLPLPSPAPLALPFYKEGRPSSTVRESCAHMANCRTLHALIRGVPEDARFLSG